MKINFSLGKEWEELKKFEKLSDDERSVVFYAENIASMNHFRLLIDHLTKIMNLNICYVTSVKDDPIFSTINKNIFPFYIGDGTARTKFFLTLKAKILIMDMPDLETFHIKRSKMHNVHYIYIFHSMFSVHSYLRKGAIDNFDSIFCVGEHHEKEIRETERVYGLKQKNLLQYGFGRLDKLLKEREDLKENRTDERLVIIAPSYGEKNLLEICGGKLIEILLKENFKVLLRPHYRILNDSKKLINSIKEKFGKNKNFIFEESVIPSESFHNSKCLISDWSGISFEYAFVFEKPIIFIDVPKKILNTEFDRISSEPIEIAIREKIGKIVSPDNLSEIPDLIKKIDMDSNLINDEIKEIRSKTVFNINKSASVGAEYIKKILDN
jgi:YidC/Oxa1 family membrane protein insertase